MAQRQDRSGEGWAPDVEAHRPYRYYTVRFVLAAGGVEFFAWKLMDPFYLQFLTTGRGVGLSPAQFALFVSLGSWVSMALDYPTGAVADKLGRRSSWGLGLFFHGLGMLWLSRCKTASQCFLVPLFQGVSWALQSGSREAWLYDHVGEEGTGRAMSFFYLASVPMTFAAVSLGAWLSSWAGIRLPIFITGALLIVLSVWILTFPENYGRRERTWIQVLRSGFRQFAKNKVLRLLALEGFLATLPIWVNSAWWLTYLVERWDVGEFGTTVSFGVAACGSAVAGLLLSRLKLSNTRRVLLYPTLAGAVAYALMPAMRRPLPFVGLVLVTLAARYCRNAGIVLLRNREISEERATALSLLGTIEGLSWAVAPIVWGALIQVAGIRAAFVAAAVASVASAALFYLATSPQ